MTEQAIECFLWQTYPAKRLLILDDGDCPAFPRGIQHPLIDYHCSNGTIWYSIAEKRNQAARLATGDILMNFDSDDFSAPERMADQVARLDESGKPITGYIGLVWYADGQAEPWRRHLKDPNWVGGSTLACTREWALAHPFRETSGNSRRIGSDTILQRQARCSGDMIAVPACEMMCARIHGDNTSPKTLKGFAPIEEPHSELMKAWALRMVLAVQ